MFAEFLAGFAPAIIGLHTVSLHLPQEDYLNNVNPGIYVRAENGATAGVYRNSIGRASFYAGITFEYGPFALTLGGLTGYKIKRESVPCNDEQKAAGWSTGCTFDFGNQKHSFGLLVAPSVRLPEVFGFTPRVTGLPKFTAKGHNVLHLTIEHGL